MVRLRNIEKNNGMISASYDPEDSGILGNFTIDISTEEVVESNLSEYDKDFPNYYSHAVRALIDLSKKDNIPIEKLVMWY